MWQLLVFLLLIYFMLIKAGWYKDREIIRTEDNPGTILNVFLQKCPCFWFSIVARDSQNYLPSLHVIVTPVERKMRSLLSEDEETVHC